MSNLYNDIDFDIDSLFNKSSPPKKRIKRPFLLIRAIKILTIGFMLRFDLYSRLIDSGIIRNWFKSFQEYWVDTLKGRPLRFHDFFWLYSHYRSKYQDVAVIEMSSNNEFLNAWQNNKNIYSLFAAVYRYALQPLQHFRYSKYLRNNISILEYGCGVAPICWSIWNYSLHSNLHLTIADIRQINFHFAMERLNGIADTIKITPYENCLQAKKYDLCFLITVLEHVPDPFETIKNITTSLRPEGVLIFDYILGEGDGLDTIEAVEQREIVLNYIDKNYILIKGELKVNLSMGMTVCKRR